MSVCNEFVRRFTMTLTVQLENRDDATHVWPSINAALQAMLRDERFRYGSGDAPKEYVHEHDGLRVVTREEWNNEYWENGVKLLDGVEI